MTNFTDGDLTGYLDRRTLAICLPINGKISGRGDATFFYNVMELVSNDGRSGTAEFTIDDLLKPIRKNIFTLDSADYLEIPEVSYHLHNVELTDHEMMTGYMRLKTMPYRHEWIMFSVGQAKFAKPVSVVNGSV